MRGVMFLIISFLWCLEHTRTSCITEQTSPNRVDSVDSLTGCGRLRPLRPTGLPFFRDLSVGETTGVVDHTSVRSQDDPSFCGTILHDGGYSTYIKTFHKTHYIMLYHYSSRFHILFLVQICKVFRSFRNDIFDLFLTDINVVLSLYL